MLYPLVESSLPEEVLRTWQRSGQREVSEDNGRKQDRLSKLLKFLQAEVENKERIDMALTGFGLSTDQEKVKSKQKSKHEHNKDVASASVLHVLREDKKVNTECIFCKSTHDYQNCESASTLTLEERKEIAKKIILVLSVLNVTISRNFVEAP